MTTEQKNWIESLSLREILDVIDTHLVANRSGQLWDVLSALRGPDKDGFKLKASTTEIIRSVALPLTRKAGAAPAKFSEFNDAILESSIDALSNGSLNPTNTHFRSHVIWAAKALKQTLKKKNP